MKFQVSIFNLVSGQKTVRFICNSLDVIRRQQQVEAEMKHSASEIVLTELVK